MLRRYSSTQSFARCGASSLPIRFAPSCCYRHASTSLAPLPPRGTCVAHHCLPAPSDLNLDQLSRQLLSRSWPHQVNQPNSKSASSGQGTWTFSNSESDGLNVTTTQNQPQQQQQGQQQQHQAAEPKSGNPLASPSSFYVTISDVRRIMPPNPTVAAMVAATPSLATMAIRPARTGAGSRQYTHSAENLLLLRAEIAPLLNNGPSAVSTAVHRDLVVFPDATVVVWGAGCGENDAAFFAHLFFGEGEGSLFAAAAAGQDQSKNISKVSPSSNSGKHVEIEFIKYRFVDADGSAAKASAANDNEEEKNDAAINEHDKAGSSVGGSSGPTPIEVIDGVATISCDRAAAGPSSSSMHLNLCYPREYDPMLKKSSSSTTTTTTTTATSSSPPHKDDFYTLEMLPVVMAVAQSARVDAIDNFIVSRVARDVRTWQRHLAFRGKLAQIFLFAPSSSSASLSAAAYPVISNKRSNSLLQSFRAAYYHAKSRPTLNQLRRCKAKLLGVMDEVTFALELEATPKLLRIHNELQRFRLSYDNVADHFELEERLEALESRTEALNESLAYLHDERHSMLTEKLTIVIVVLIFAEVVVALTHH